MKKSIQLLLFMVLFLSNCIEYQEEMWFERDGSGKLTMKISLNEYLSSLDEGSSDNDFNEDEMVKDLNSHMGIKVTSSKSYYHNEKKWIEINLKFDSFDNLSKINEDETELNFMGKIKLTYDNKGNLNFSREIFIDNIDTDDDENDATMIKAMLSKYKWEYIVHFPSKILVANAAEENIDESKKTVKWTFPLMVLAKKSQTMEATFVNPNALGNNKYFVSFFVVFIFLVVYGLMKRKKI